jgi:hypothetical protein
MLNQQAIKQLSVNLESKNFDIVMGSLRIQLALSLRDPERIKPLISKITSIGMHTNHFGIATLCKDILVNLQDIIPSLANPASLISKRLTPKLKTTDNLAGMFYANCDHSIEYSLGSKDYKYALSNICEVFKYDCKKAYRQVTHYMKDLGYKKGTQYWKERPSHWRHDYEGNRYETTLSYYARHAIQLFLMWCVKNLSTSFETWEALSINERRWDASLPELLIEERPPFFKFTDLRLDVVTWLKKRIKKADAYELLNPNTAWVPLYEDTTFRSEDKSFNRFVITCFIRTPIGKLSRKIQLAPVHYSCSKCYINELPMEAKEKGWMSLSDYNHYDFLEDKLTPSCGIVLEDSGDYVKLFPAPEIVEYFKLTQKKNSLVYYKGREQIIRCINWRGGYHRNVGSRGEDRFELANYGRLLMIKTKYLKRYLEENGFKLIAAGRIWKRKVDQGGRDYDYKRKNSRYKLVSFEIVKI